MLSTPRDILEEKMDDILRVFVTWFTRSARAFRLGHDFTPSRGEKVIRYMWVWGPIESP